MISYFSNELTGIRQISDLRFGIPIILGDNDTYEMIVAIETLNEETFQKILAYSSSSNLEPYIAITKNRAIFLKARVYDGNIARLKLSNPISFNWIKSTADPSKDFEYPLKGPYFSIREGKSNISKVAINFCKKAQLLPAVLVVPINSKDLKELKKLGFLYQKISKNFETKKITDNLSIVSSGRVPIPGGLNSKVSVFRDLNSLTEHYAIEIGCLDLTQPILTRIHSACFTGDIFHSEKCDCGEQLNTSVEYMIKNKGGVILYLDQEGRGIGLANKMRAYTLQSKGLDTVDADHNIGFLEDERDFAVAVKILKLLKIKKVNIITNNFKKMSELEKEGIKINKQINTKPTITKFNKNYFKTRIKKTGYGLK